VRINVYHHELPFMINRAEVVATTADTGNTFYGIRFYTENPVMHHEDDDDSSAITLWGMAHRNLSHTDELRDIFNIGLRLCDEIDARVSNEVIVTPTEDGVRISSGRDPLPPMDEANYAPGAVEIEAQGTLKEVLQHAFQAGWIRGENGSVSTASELGKEFETWFREIAGWGEKSV
jgi:hypothetical protein